MGEQKGKKAIRLNVFAF